MDAQEAKKRLTEIQERCDKASPDKELGYAEGRVELIFVPAGMHKILEQGKPEREEYVNAHVLYDDGDWCAEVHDNLGLGIDGGAFAEFFAHARADIPWLLEQLSAAAAHSAQVEAQLESVKEERDELQLTYDLMANASRRAVKQWREQDPEARKLRLPDLKEHIVWAFTELAKAEAELVKLREALRWIPVEEKLPEGELVGIFTSRFNNYLARRRGEYFEFSLGGKLHVWEISDGQATFDYEAVTHWRPLPAPPDVKVGEALGETGPEEK